jgi:hypothetical protein
MAKKFLTGIDLVQNQLLNAQIQNLASAPSTPVPGQVYFDTTQNALYVWNAVAAAWQLKGTDSLLLQGQNGAYYLARANQTGTQLAATISNLNATVIAYTLDTFAAPVAAVSMNSQRLTNVGTPTAATDATNKTYVDNLAQGFTAKPTAQVATAAALPVCTYANGTAGVGAMLTATANGVLTVDTSYAVLLGDSVLVKNQASAFQNGLYNVTTLGTGSVPWVLTRNVDMDQSTEFGGGFVPVENNGATTGNSLWLCNVANPITVGTTSVLFTQLNSPTSFTQGNGIAIAANVISAVAAVSGGVVVVSGGIELDTTVAVRKYAAAFGDGSSTAYTITHNLGTQDVTVGIYSATTPYTEVEADVAHSNTNTCTLTFAVAPTSNQYRVVCHG